MPTGADPDRATLASRDWLGRLALLALVLNGFAIIAVNYWIYTARWAFIERNAGYKKPPTISRAISDPGIGEPFSLWITLSGIMLVLGVWILALHYRRVVGLVAQPGRFLRAATAVAMPLIMGLQVTSAIGMYMLSSFRFPLAHEMHMLGSYLFFISQALVVVLFTLFNHALLRDRGSLADLVSRDELSVFWVRLRYRAGLASIALIGVYFALFKAKDVYGYPEAPALYIAYVTTEPMVISAFLLVLGLCHADLHGRRG